MKLNITREEILTPIQIISGVVERKQTMPVLSNILLEAESGRVTLTGTNMEVELVCTLESVAIEREGRITVPARKLSDICRSLPTDAMIELALEGDKMHLRSGKSHFTLATLPADQFPNTEETKHDLALSFSQKDFKRMLDATSFAMAQQDVRYYLNGMLLEMGNQYVRMVATDGHRLALSSLVADQSIDVEKQVIVPRKGIIELGRLLSDTDDEVVISIGENHIFSKIGNFKFTSKLIDGKFPDYNRVIPKGGDKVMIADRSGLKNMLSRASILSHENIRGIQLHLTKNQLQVFANNPEHEQAEDCLEVGYDNDDLQIGFNVSYLIDAMNVISSENVKITMLNSNSSALIESLDDDGNLYVIMPMRL
jgi:DNA polymerase-3 subunit beta